MYACYWLFIAYFFRSHFQKTVFWETCGIAHFRENQRAKIYKVHFVQWLSVKLSQASR